MLTEPLETSKIISELIHSHCKNSTCLMCITNGKGNGTPLQYSCLKIPWMEEPGGLQSMGLLRVRHD